MRKDNRKVLSPSDLTRGSTSNQLTLLFNLDSRVKPEGDSGGNENGCGWKWRGAAAVAVMSVCLVVCMGASEALAQCAVPPTCESLGYDLTATDCEGKRALKCPFDASKVFCSQTKYEGIAVGNIYYSDGTCDANVIAGKTPIGVVGYITDGGKHGGVISLEEGSAYWSTPSYSNLSCLPDLDINGATADMNGKSNTTCILSETSSGNTYPAAEYCNNYKPVSSGKGSSGWYLPSAGELKMISLYYSALNISLQRLPKTQLLSNYYWSSSEYDNTTNYIGGSDAWFVSVSDGDMRYGYKDYLRYLPVRCVLAF